MQMIRCIILIFFALISNASFAGSFKYATSQINTSLNTGGNSSTYSYYHDICENNQHGTCIDDFKNANVQYLQAKGLIDLYLESKKKISKDKYTCSAKIYQRFNDDYIACSTIDDKQHFQFHFDDVFESIDADIHKSVASSVCDMYGGRFEEERYGGLDCFNISAGSYIDKELQNRFGCSAEYMPASANNYGTTPEYWRIKCNHVGELRTAYNIDNYKFKNLQIKSGADLQFLLKRYAETMVQKAGSKLTSFNCKNSFSTVRTGNLTNLKDDALTCNINDKPVDFVFDDLNESWNSVSDGGSAGLQCIASAGGTFDGRRCLGFNKTECKELNDKITGGTRWDDSLDTCVLNFANKAANINRVTEVATAAGIVVVGTASIILSGGTSTVVLIGYIGTTAAVVGTTTSQVITSVVREKTAKFLADSSKCQSATCAKAPLQDLLVSAKDFESAIPDQMSDAVNDEILRLTQLLIMSEDENCTAFYDYDAIKQMKSQIRQSKKAECDKLGCGLCNTYFDAAASGKESIMQFKTAADILTLVGDVATVYPVTVKIAELLRISSNFPNIVKISAQLQKTLKTLKVTSTTIDKFNKVIDASIISVDTNTVF